MLRHILQVKAINFEIAEKHTVPKYNVDAKINIEPVS